MRDTSGARQNQCKQQSILITDAPAALSNLEPRSILSILFQWKTQKVVSIIHEGIIKSVSKVDIFVFIVGGRVRHPMQVLNCVNMHNGLQIMFVCNPTLSYC